MFDFRLWIQELKRYTEWHIGLPLVHTVCKNYNLKNNDKKSLMKNLLFPNIEYKLTKLSLFNSTSRERRDVYTINMVLKKEFEEKGG